MISSNQATLQRRTDFDWSDFVVGPCTGTMIGAACVSPRTIPYALAILAVVIFCAFSTRKLKSALRPEFHTAELTLLALLLYAACSAFWAFMPSGVVLPLLASVSYFAAYLFLSRYFGMASEDASRRMGQGLAIGLAFGIAYLGIELWSSQSIKLAVLNGLHIPKHWLNPARDFVWDGNRLVSIAPVDIKRNIAPVSTLLWPALLAIGGLVGEKSKIVWCVALYLAAAVLILSADHDTSKAAIIWSTLIFAVALARPIWSNRILQIVWVGACLAVIPATLALHRLDLQNASWLQYSFRHRVVIWNYTSEQTMKHPIFGIGAGMMYQLDPGGEQRSGDNAFPTVAQHAHNVYLQTWFELGAIGAALLTLLGLAVIDRIRNLPPESVAYAQATFASVMVMIATSYGTWQFWFLAMFALTGVMFAVGARLNDPIRSETPTGSSFSPSAKPA